MAHAPLALPPPTSAPWLWREPSWKVHLHLEGGSNREHPAERKLADALDTIRTFGRRRAIIYNDDPVRPTVLEVLKQTGPEFTTSFETEAWALLLAADRCGGGRLWRCTRARKAPPRASPGRTG